MKIGNHSHCVMSIHLFRALAIVCAGTLSAVAAEGVPYDLEQETYKTELLFSYDGCSDHPVMRHCGKPTVFGKYIYAAIIAHGRVPRVLQIPLDGDGPAKIGRLEPEVWIGDDAHKYFAVAVDKAGYIHLTGNMHGGPWKYWISAKPEDVSKFVKASAAQIPPGGGITYPHFSTDRNGNLYLSSRGSAPWTNRDNRTRNVHVGMLSVYDADTRSWRILGGDIPTAFGGKAGHPVTIWEDNFQNGTFYARHQASFVEAPDGILHFAFSALNDNPLDYAKAPGHTITDVMYGMSTDAGRTLRRSDGTEILWPVRAEAGPYQAEVLVTPPDDGSLPWLGLGASVQLDWKNRPMVRYEHKQEGAKTLRLEDGKWVPCPNEAFANWRDNHGVLMAQGRNSTDLVRRWDENHVRVVKLGQNIDKLDEDYLRETGTLIYKTKKDRAGNTVINIMRTTVTRLEEE